MKGEKGMWTATYCEKYKASVAYKLCAELRRSNASPRIKRAKGAIPVTLCRTKAEVEGDDGDVKAKIHFQSFEHSSSRLQAGREEQSRSFREWTTDSFTKKAPRIHFRISAHAPTVLLQDSVVPIKFAIVVDRNLTTAAPPLQFKFVTARFEFKTLTQLKASYLWANFTAEPSEVVFAVDWNIQGGETIWKGEEGPIIIKRDVVPPKGSITPSFRAKYIDRSYFIKVNLVIELGGKRFEAKYRWTPVTLITKEVETLGEGDEIIAGLFVGVNSGIS